MRKILIIAILGFAALCVGFFFLADYGLRRATGAVLPAARNAFDAYGIRLSEVSVGEVGVSFPLDASWQDVSGRLESSRNSALAKQAALNFSIDRIDARPLSAGLDRARLSLRGVEARELYSLKSAGEADVSGLWFRVDLFSKTFDVPLKDPMPALQEEVAAARAVLSRGETEKPFVLKGAFGFKLGGEPIELSLSSVKRGDVYGLEADRAGVEALASAYSESLTDAEIDVIASYPLQAPQMLQIKTYAARTAKAAWEKDRATPRDAYRHVLWSYLLTLQFGPELAEKITDAHEIGSTTNTAADHRMDYNNNRMGRQYALGGRNEGEILGLVKTAPEVIRSPR